MEVASEDDKPKEIKQELEESMEDDSLRHKMLDVDESSQSRHGCSSPATSIKEEKHQPRVSEEPMDMVDSMDDMKKMERKDKKSKKEKKDKKIKKEKELVKEEEQEPELPSLPAPILKETELKR